MDLKPILKLYSRLSSCSTVKVNRLSALSGGNLKGGNLGTWCNGQLMRPKKKAGMAKLMKVNRICHTFDTHLFGRRA